jgi:two-component system, chemotaxis family, CheB/CheR fusion protein
MMPGLPIVGIGASAGGVEALEQFLKAVPADNGMAFVIVTHLPPNYDSMMAEILGRATKMPVFERATASWSNRSRFMFYRRARP